MIGPPPGASLSFIIWEGKSGRRAKKPLVLLLSRTCHSERELWRTSPRYPLCIVEVSCPIGEERRAKRSADRSLFFLFLYLGPDYNLWSSAVKCWLVLPNTSPPAAKNRILTNQREGARSRFIGKR